MKVVVSKISQMMFEVESCIRLGEILSCSREGGNREDPFAVPVQKSSATVSHVPRRISCVCSQRRFDATPHRCSLRYDVTVHQNGRHSLPSKRWSKFSQMVVEPRKPRKLRSIRYIPSYQPIHATLMSPRKLSWQEGLSDCPQSIGQ